MLKLNKKCIARSVIAYLVLLSWWTCIFCIDSHPWLFPAYKPAVVTSVRIASLVLSLVAMLVRGSTVARLVSYYHTYSTPLYKCMLFLLYFLVPIMDVVYIFTGMECYVYPFFLEAGTGDVSSARIASKISEKYFCGASGEDDYCLLVSTPAGDVSILLREGWIDMYLLGEDTSLSPYIAFTSNSGWYVDWSHDRESYAFACKIACFPSEEVEAARLIINAIDVLVEEAKNAK